MGAPTSSYANAGIALRVSGALKPHHHDKVKTPLVGISFEYHHKLSAFENTVRGTMFTLRKLRVLHNSRELT
jgi:hypothetical protein